MDKRDWTRLLASVAVGIAVKIGERLVMFWRGKKR